MSGQGIFSGLSVLVVDDNAHSANLLATILRELGVGRIVRAGDGAEAMARLKMQAQDKADPPFDVIMSDWQMQQVSGLSLLQWVRQSGESASKETPFIMVTGHADRRHVAEARDLGVNEILAKPFSVHMVARKLMSVVQVARPFVEAETYIGPDRRRRRADGAGVTERRRAAE